MADSMDYWRAVLARCDARKDQVLAMKKAKAMRKLGKYDTARVTLAIAEARVALRQRQYELLRHGRSGNESVTCPLLREVG